MYLSLIQIAESFGVSERVVEGWIRDEGLPHMTDRRRLIFDRAQVAQWAAMHGLAAQAGFLAPESSMFATGCRLEPLLRVGGIWRNVGALEVADVFDQIVAALPGITPPVRRMLAERLRGKNGVTWSPIGGGIALPHPSTRIALGRNSGVLALLQILGDAFPFPGVAPDGIPITNLFFFIAPSPRAHLDLLGRLSRMLAQRSTRGLLKGNAGDEEIFAAFAADDAAVMINRHPEGKS
jgi:PTS system nitrogen regulatory IIA component